MKTLLRLMCLFGVIMILTIPGVAYAQDGGPQDKVIFGDNFTLAEGESVGNLTVLGGNSELKPGSTAATIVMIGGNLSVEGRVTGEIHIYGGNLTLSETAVVDGDVSVSGGNLNQVQGATIHGKVTQSQNWPLDIDFPEVGSVTLPRLFGNTHPIVGRTLSFLSQTIGLTVLAMLVSLVAPKLMARAGDAAALQPLQAGGVGLLVAILTPVLLVGFAITLIGIPITLLLAVAAVVVFTFGWIALGLEVGTRLGAAFNQEWPVVLSAGLGTLVLSFVANGIGLMPCVGWIVPTLVGFLGMGGVLLSRFGTREIQSPAPLTPAISV